MFKAHIILLSVGHISDPLSIYFPKIVAVLILVSKIGLYLWLFGVSTCGCSTHEEELVQCHAVGCRLLHHSDLDSKIRQRK